MSTKRRLVRALLAVALGGAQLGWIGSAPAGTLDKLRTDQSIRIAYRADAKPFSFKDDKSPDPTGFMIGLCQAVTKRLAEQIGVPSIKITYVPVTAVNRFETMKSGGADLLCEATTDTLSRRTQVDFSIPTFIDGASVLVADQSVRDLKGLAGKKIGVLAGTTTENELRDALKSADVSAEVVPVSTHTEGIGILDDGKVSAYFADRSILMYLINDSKDKTKLGIAREYLSIEPYALALPRGDEEFRLAVDTALSHIYRSGDIDAIFSQNFGGQSKLSDTVKLLYQVSALPD